MNKKIILISTITFFIFIIIIFLFLNKEKIPLHFSAEAISSSEIKLLWDGDEKSIQYNIYRTEDLSSPYEKIGFSLEEKYLDKDLKPNTLYYYVVTQTVDLKESDYSAFASVKTKPAKVTGVEAIVVDFQKDLKLQINIIWDYMVGKEGYVVYRSEEKDGIYQKIGTVANEVYSDLNVLPNKTYYYVVTQKVDSHESVYSEKITAKTGSLWACGEKINYGGKDYKTIKIGEQCWFQEDVNIEGEVSAKCQVEKKCYNNRDSMCEKYGAFYNYENVSCGEKEEGAQGICPLGWRIPTDNDWKILEMEAGMREEQRNLYGLRGVNEASKLSGESELWKDGILKNNNLFGVSDFNILPAGFQSFFKVDSFIKLGEINVFWSSTKANEGPLKEKECTAWETAYFVREFSYNNTQIKRYCLSKKSSAHLRCMRDY